MGSLGATPALLKLGEGGLRDLDFKADVLSHPSSLISSLLLHGAAWLGSQMDLDPHGCPAVPPPHCTFTISCAICLVLLTSRTILASLTTE